MNDPIFNAMISQVTTGLLKRIVETQCGGHLGWQETPPDNAFGSSSWADNAVADFFDAIMKVNKESPEKFNKETKSVAQSKFDYTESSIYLVNKELAQIKAHARAFTKMKPSKL